MKNTVQIKWFCLVGAALPVVMMVLAGCGSAPGTTLKNESTEPLDTQDFRLVARFAHISDAQITDEESPGRLTVAASINTSAWRPQEAYSAQVLDGFVRTVNKIHATGSPVGFLIHTGDGMDNAQMNELSWFVSVLDGGTVDPRSGPDDREAGSLPDVLLDPHQPFQAQGLYQQGKHGPLASIPWYNIIGNHDHFAVGVFPIVTDLFGLRTSPLPFDLRIGLFYPVRLNPTGSIAWAPITPANPGPPAELDFPVRIQSNQARRYVTNQEIIEMHLASNTQPRGHGFSAECLSCDWYSVSPRPGLRLIGLNSASPLIEQRAVNHSEGAVTFSQGAFLEEALSKACAAGEVVIVATHHPADSLRVSAGTAVTGFEFVEILNRHACVALHLVGHWHQDVVIDRGEYVEMITSSTLDAPQTGRIVEIWQSTISPDDVALRYRFFSHLDDIQVVDEAHEDMFVDPLMPMRRVAHELALQPR